MKNDRTGHYKQDLYHNNLFKINPSEVITCNSTDDVVNALNKAQSSGKGFTILGGGHNHEAFCVANDKIVIDLSGIRTFEFDETKEHLTVGAGYTNAEILAKDELRDSKKLIVTGECPSVGIGGFILGGGWSNQARQIGFAAQNVVKANVVRFKENSFISEDVTGDELNNILAAGGGNFCVVTEFTCKTFDYNSSIINAYIEATVPFDHKDKASTFVAAWMKFVETGKSADIGGIDIPNFTKKLTSNIRLNKSILDGKETLLIRISGRFMDSNLVEVKSILDKVKLIFNLTINTPHAKFQSEVATYKPYNDITKILRLKIDGSITFNEIKDYVELAFFDELSMKSDSKEIYSCLERRKHKVSSAFIKDEGDYKAVISESINYIENQDHFPNIYSIITFHGIGGKTKENKTSFGFKDKNFILQMQSWLHPTFISDQLEYDIATVMNWPTQFRSYLDNKGLVEGAFINFIDRNLPLNYYYDSNYDHLRQFKKVFDPSNVFNFPMSIPPAE